MSIEVRPQIGAPSQPPPPDAAVIIEPPPSIEEEKAELSLPDSSILEGCANTFDVLTRVDESMKVVNQAYTPTKTFINCDLRYFNFDYLVSQTGYFDGTIVH
jgi:hypothetical protein